MSEPLTLTEKDLTAFVCAALAQCLAHPSQQAWEELRKLARRVEAFLAAHPDEHEFILFSKDQFFALQIGGATSSELSMEQRIAEIERREYTFKRHLERIEETLRQFQVSMQGIEESKP